MSKRTKAVKKDKHTHKYELVNKPVLLGKYRNEEGKPKYINTTGKDILKQRICKCGATETYDLERHKA